MTCGVNSALSRVNLLSPDCLYKRILNGGISWPTNIDR